MHLHKLSHVFKAGLESCVSVVAVLALFFCLQAICPSMALVLAFVEPFYGGFLLEVRL